MLRCAASKATHASIASCAGSEVRLPLATGYLQPVEYPGTRIAAPVPRSPVYLSETPGEIRTRAPLLGEHTDEVLASVGYSAAEIAKLRESGAV